MHRTVLYRCGRSNLTGSCRAVTARNFETASTKTGPLRKAGTTMKRAVPSSPRGPKAKKQKVAIPEYHLAPAARNSDGEIIWPAPTDQIERARGFILEWLVI